MGGGGGRYEKEYRLWMGVWGNILRYIFSGIFFLTHIETKFQIERQTNLTCKMKRISA
jgi:hypothetical protein